MNLAYLERNALRAERLAWRDRVALHGDPRKPAQASNYVQAIEERQGLKVGVRRRVAFRVRYIDADDRPGSRTV